MKLHFRDTTSKADIADALRTMWAALEQAGSVRERLDRVLRQAIVRMVLPPGQALSEKDTAEVFAVSRQPVREAFIRLSEVGLVEVLPQRGTFVVGVSIAAVHEARFVREAVELAVARQAAEQGLDAAIIAELYELIERQRRCAELPDHDRFFSLDEAFHRTLILGVEQRTAWTVVEKVKAHLDRLRYLSVPETTPIDKLVGQHLAIVQAIEQQDVEAAQASMRLHQREILQSLPDLIRRFPQIYEGYAGGGIIHTESKA